MLSANLVETRSSASRLKIQSLRAWSTANCFWSAKPLQTRDSTRAPAFNAISHVASVEPESTTTISSAHETDWQAARIFSSSLSVIIVAEIFNGGSVVNQSLIMQTPTFMG